MAREKAVMPVVFAKGYGKGRVYYNALGHRAAVIGEGPAAELTRRGLLWAARQAQPCQRPAPRPPAGSPARPSP